MHAFTHMCVCVHVACTLHPPFSLSLRSLSLSLLRGLEWGEEDEREKARKTCKSCRQAGRLERNLVGEKGAIPIDRFCPSQGACGTKYVCDYMCMYTYVHVYLCVCVYIYIYYIYIYMYI
jgi:hypothetical protein